MGSMTDWAKLIGLITVGLLIVLLAILSVMASLGMFVFGIEQFFKFVGWVF